MGAITNGAQMLSIAEMAAKIEPPSQQHIQAQQLAANETRSIAEMAGNDGPGNNGQPPTSTADVNYFSDLWKLTAPAATNEAHIPHPELPATTSGNIHASVGLELRDREWAAQQNAGQDPRDTPTYHTQAPVVVYNTDIDAEGVVRVHTLKSDSLNTEDTTVGNWSTRSSDINDGHLPAKEIADRLSLPSSKPLPTHISDVTPPVGTTVEASRPISGEARQFSMRDRIASWFGNTRDVG